MPSQPKAGYPTANIAGQNDLPINTTTPSQYDGAVLQREESYPRHPANTETGTRQCKAATDRAANLA